MEHLALALGKSDSLFPRKTRKINLDVDFIISFLTQGQNYLLLIGRAAKTLAPYWLSTHLVGFFILRSRDNNDFFQLLWSLTVCAGFSQPEILGNQVLQL